MTAAIIVSYNPNEEDLLKLLTSLSKQDCEIFIVDNASNSKWLNVKWLGAQDFSANYIQFEDNFGIAAAQNKGLEAAIRLGHKQFILFDQDSEPSGSLISDLLNAQEKLLQKGIKVGAVGPLFREAKNGLHTEAVRYCAFRTKKIKISPNSHLPVESDCLIASGSLISINALSDIGLMQSDLFIDWVDIEWCFRAISKGYKNFIVPNAIMEHSIGDAIVQFNGKDVTKHSDTRNYYRIRNVCYLLRQSHMGFWWRFLTLYSIPKFIVVQSLTSKNKVHTLCVFLKASIDGFRGRLGKNAIF